MAWFVAALMMGCTRFRLLAPALAPESILAAPADRLEDVKVADETAVQICLVYTPMTMDSPHELWTGRYPVPH